MSNNVKEIFDPMLEPSVYISLLESDSENVLVHLDNHTHYNYEDIRIMPKPDY